MANSSLWFIFPKQAAEKVNQCAGEFLQILQKRLHQSDTIDVQVPFTRLAFDVMLRCSMGARLPIQQGGQEIDSLMNSGRNSVAQLGTSWLVFLSKLHSCCNGNVFRVE